jgi:hypothetical protein
MGKEVVVIYFETLSLLAGLKKTIYPSVRTVGLHVEIGYVILQCKGVLTM